MNVFLLSAAALLILVVLFLVRPLWMARKAAVTADAQTVNRAILSSEMAELDREAADGNLDSQALAQARTELQRRLLDEAGASEEVAAIRPARKTAFVLMGLIPVLALGGYTWLGKPQALDPAAVERPAEVTQAQIEAMVARLAKRLKDNPGDTQGWLMLARSYRNLDRLPEAAEAYSKVEQEVARNPDLLTDYAEILGTVAQSFKGKPAKMVKQALELDPQHPRALLLAGVAAMEAKDFPATIAYWERLLPLVEPGSEAESMIKGGLDRLRQSQSKQSEKSSAKPSGK